MSQRAQAGAGLTGEVPLYWLDAGRGRVPLALWLSQLRGSHLSAEAGHKDPQTDVPSNRCSANLQE